MESLTLLHNEPAHSLPHGPSPCPSFHEPRGSGAGVPPAAGASRPRIRRGRDAREDNRDGSPTTARPCSWSQYAQSMAWGLSMNLKTLALILKGLRVSGSWSQCMRKKTERGLSMNRKVGQPSRLSGSAGFPPAPAGKMPALLHRQDACATCNPGSWSQCMRKNEWGLSIGWGEGVRRTGVGRIGSRFVLLSRRMFARRANFSSSSSSSSSSSIGCLGSITRTRTRTRTIRLRLRRSV